MASYTEIFALSKDDTLRNRVVVALSVSANTILQQATPAAADVAWASYVAGNPRAEGAKAHLSVLVENRANTVAQIQGASDAQIQTNVDAIVPSLITAYSTP